MAYVTCSRNIEALQDIQERIRSLNLTMMIVETGFQIVDNNTDEEFNVTSSESALDLIDEYHRHHIKRTEIIKNG